MKKGLLALLVCSICCIPLAAQAAMNGSNYTVFDDSSIQWKPSPKNLPAGSQSAYLVGNPNSSGLFIMWCKVPAGFVLPPHFHNSAQQINLISGDYHIGFGDKLDKTAGIALTPGTLLVTPPKTHQFNWSDNGAIFQIIGNGHEELKYVNPSDNPMKKS